MKIIGILLPFIAGLSAVTLAIGIALFFMAIFEWVDEHYINWRVRKWLSDAMAALVTIVVVAIIFFGIWLVGVALLSALWIK